MRGRRKGLNYSSKKRKSNGAKRFVLLVICLCIMVAGVFYKSIYEEFKKIIPTNSNNVEIVRNLLLVGIDNDNINADIEDSKVDSICLMNYNSVEKKYKFIFIPKNTEVEYENKILNISSLYDINDITNLVMVIEDIFNININDTLIFDYLAFRGIIDSIDGIDLNVSKENFYYDLNNDIKVTFKKDEIMHLNSSQAEKFIRWEKNDKNIPLNGDIEIISTRMKFTDLVIKKLKEKSNKISDNMINIISDHVKTNLNKNSINLYGDLFASSNEDSIETMILPGSIGQVDDLWCYNYDKEKCKTLISNITSNSNKENNTDNSNVSDKLEHMIQIINGVSRGNISVKIENCTNVSGLATSFQEEMIKMGYKNIEVKNGESINEPWIYIRDEKYRAIISTDLDIKNIEVGITDTLDSTGQYDVIILLGKEYTKVGDTE